MGQHTRLTAAAEAHRWPRDWFAAQFAKAQPLLTAQQLRERVLAANCRLVGTLHLLIQVRSWTGPCGVGFTSRSASWPEQSLGNMCLSKARKEGTLLVHGEGSTLGACASNPARLEGSKTLWSEVGGGLRSLLRAGARRLPERRGVPPRCRWRCISYTRPASWRISFIRGQQLRSPSWLSQRVGHRRALARMHPQCLHRMTCASVGRT